VLDFEATPAGWRLVVEGSAGASVAVRLHGETPASATGATLRKEGAGTEATVLFPRSSTGPFTTAEVDLYRGRRPPDTP
jgi:hypothetical protein